MPKKWEGRGGKDDIDYGGRFKRVGKGVTVKKKVKASSYIAQYPVLRTAQSTFTLYFPDRPVHSDTISASLGSIQPYATNNAQRLIVHISTTVYSQVLILFS